MTYILQVSEHSRLPALPTSIFVNRNTGNNVTQAERIYHRGRHKKPLPHDASTVAQSCNFFSGDAVDLSCQPSFIHEQVILLSCFNSIKNDSKNDDNEAGDEKIYRAMNRKN